MLGLGGYGSDSSNDSSQSVKRLKIEEPETADDRIKRELDFSTWGCTALHPEVSPMIAVDVNASSLFKALRDENKNPTEFIIQHHDFSNPERTNSIIESLRSEDGVPIHVHESNIYHRNSRLSLLLDATNLPEIMSAKQKTEFEQRAKGNK